MSVRCRFFCSEVGESAYHAYDPETKSTKTKKLYRAKMHAVTGSGSPENQKFFDATPQGTFEVATVLEKHFEVGKEYYLDITPAN